MAREGADWHEEEGQHVGVLDFVGYGEFGLRVVDSEYVIAEPEGVSVVLVSTPPHQSLPLREIK